MSGHCGEGREQTSGQVPEQRRQAGAPGGAEVGLECGWEPPGVGSRVKGIDLAAVGYQPLCQLPSSLLPSSLYPIMLGERGHAVLILQQKGTEAPGNHRVSETRNKTALRATAAPFS